MNISSKRKSIPLWAIGSVLNLLLLLEKNVILNTSTVDIANKLFLFLSKIESIQDIPANPSLATAYSVVFLIFCKTLTSDG